MSERTHAASKHSTRIAFVIAVALCNSWLSAEERNPIAASATEPSTTNDVRAKLTARQVRGAASMLPLAEEAPAKLVIDPPVPRILERGMVLLQFRTENLQVVPVFGPDAIKVSPRLGHLHVRVDDNPWVWAHTSPDDLIINRLTAGPHKIHVDLVNANHEVLAREVVNVEVPQGPHTAAFPHEHDLIPEVNAKDPSSAKLIVDALPPDRLARGVAFIQYRTENAQIAPVFGTAALEISPRICHLHVTVDGARWRWAHTSGGPLILGGLPPGPHTILIELVNANHKPIAKRVVSFEVPE
jgi:hypothetical protein